MHWRVEGLRAELGGEDLVILEHEDDAVAQDRFPLHTTVSTTILGLHHAERSHGRVHLVLERHGSLHVSGVVAVLRGLGLGLTISPRAATGWCPGATSSRAATR